MCATMLGRPALPALSERACGGRDRRDRRIDDRSAPCQELPQWGEARGRGVGSCRSDAGDGRSGAGRSCRARPGACARRSRAGCATAAGSRRSTAGTRDRQPRVRLGPVRLGPGRNTPRPLAPGSRSLRVPGWDCTRGHGRAPAGRWCGAAAAARLCVDQRPWLGNTGHRPGTGDRAGRPGVATGLLLAQRPAAARVRVQLAGPAAGGPRARGAPYAVTWRPKTWRSA
ncbi:hypothetical protein BN2156_01134 [Mycolicibacterium neworleansense]|uniref:Uncharacterized protein n=1 Tax=Mycolicibacterium neworleansense TaxID=146018 RepID=A0A0H5RKL6_9MYCO|nr:hypothetical protein BN2156_01134 [Mycolicibacterium neworleansense]